MNIIEKCDRILELHAEAKKAEADLAYKKGRHDEDFMSLVKTFGYKDNDVIALPELVKKAYRAGWDDAKSEKTLVL